MVPIIYAVRDNVYGITIHYGLEGTGIKSPLGRFFRNRPNDPEVHATFYILDTVSPSGVKRPGGGGGGPFNTPPLLVPRLNKE
jgi:hypothetical protein